MVNNYQRIIDDFLVAYTTNELQKHFHLLTETVEISYSNIGQAIGLKQVLTKLAWNLNFNINMVTTSNRIGYTSKGKYIDALIAHHLIGFEENNELFPLLFGGKYVFVIDIKTEKIEKIFFVLEYQTENTSFVKTTWKLTNGFNDYTSFSIFNPNTALEFIKRETLNVIETAIALSKLFFWCLDTQDKDFLLNVVSDDFKIVRDSNNENIYFQGNKTNLLDYISDTNQYFDFNQHSIKINKSENLGTEIRILAQHLTPQRMGTKKINTLTKYHSFFDEDIEIVCSSAEQQLTIKSVKICKAVEISYNSFMIVNY